MSSLQLVDLDPMFIRREERIEEWTRAIGDDADWRARGCPTEKVIGPREYRVPVKTIVEADGVIFQCPKCFIEKGGVGVHYVICWRPHVPPDVAPKPGRWEFEGSDLRDLTLVAGSSSVQLHGGCNAHFFVRRGAIEKAE